MKDFLIDRFVNQLRSFNNISVLNDERNEIISISTDGFDEITTIKLKQVCKQINVAPMYKKRNKEKEEDLSSLKGKQSKGTARMLPKDISEKDFYVYEYTYYYNRDTHTLDIPYNDVKYICGDLQHIFRDFHAKQFSVM